MTISLFSAVFCYAVDNIGADDMVDISVNDDFTDDCVIVVLDNETSLKFKEYDSNSFSTIDCKQVRDLTYSIDASVEAAVDNIAQHYLDDEPLMEYNGVELGKYNRILCIELTTPGKANVISAINKLQQVEGVLYASPNYKFEATKTSEDPYVNDTTEAGNSNYQYWQLAKIFNAWNINTGSETVRVGIMDSGIDRSHEDLIDNLNTQLGQNFLGDGTGVYVDSYGHGTAVAGIIGAQGDNDIGVSGVCWDVELVSLKVSNDEGDSEFADIAAAVNYAYANDIDILNFSSSSKSEMLDDLKV